MNGRRPVLRSLATAGRLCWEADRVALILTVLLAVIGGVAPVAVAVLTKDLVDLLVAGRDTQPVGNPFMTCVGIAGAGAVAVCAEVAGGYLAARLQRATTLLGQDRIFEKLQQMHGLRPFESPAQRDRIATAVGAAQHAPHEVASFGLQSGKQLISMAGYTVAIFQVWPPIAAILVVTALPAAAAHFYLARLGARQMEQSVNLYRWRDYFQRISLDPATAQEIRLHGLGYYIRSRLMGSLRSATAVEMRNNRRGTVAEVAFSIVNAGVLLVGLVVVANRAAAGEISVGDVTLFFTAVAMVQSTIGNMIVKTGLLFQGLLLFGRYGEFLDAESELVSKGRLPGRLCDGITLEDLWFRYTQDSPWILRGVTLHLPVGALTAIVGPNGAGKSTLIKLLLRYYDPDSGRILWDGIDIRDFDPVAYRKRLAAIFQQYSQFAFTAAENIGISDLGASLDVQAIRHAADRAGAHDFVADLPKGYDTVLTREFDDPAGGITTTLSGGQWQRIALARALYNRDADLTILDEPSSALDPIAEGRLTRLALHELRSRTAVLISHRMGSVSEADQIFVMNDGLVVEAGDHEALMLRNGVYHEAFTLQAEGYRR